MFVKGVSSLGMWFYILCPILSIIAIATIAINIVITKKVKARSRILKELEALNASTSFFEFESKYTMRKHYDNKRNFNKIAPAYIMAADIRNNLIHFEDICEKTKRNRELYKTYIEGVSQISSSATEKEYKDLKLLGPFCKIKEKKLFKKATLKPLLDCKYTVIITYSSPKGRVKLRKEASFNFDNIFACLESVSRSRLDRNTYRILSCVERGEVSDSLRYDIMNRDGFRCVICGASANEGAHLHVDHIIPIAKGGKSVPSNLRTLCERCNIGKSAKIEHDNPNQRLAKEENLICPQCGGALCAKMGKYGKFYGCSNYPLCKYTRNISK